MEVLTNTTDPTKLSQKDAIFAFTMEALGLTEKPADAKLKDLVTKEVRKIVRQRLFAAVKAGTVKLSKQFDDSKLKKYCSSLINNWVKKDPRFN
jgi:hypothetical protein